MLVTWLMYPHWRQRPRQPRMAPAAAQHAGRRTWVRPTWGSAALFALLWLMIPAARSSAQTPASAVPAATPFFTNPVGPDAPISGYFDHDPARGSLVFYDGRNGSGGSFYFRCPAIGGATIVCDAGASGEQECTPEHQLWYDNHKGTDFEYSPDWYTGAVCDRERFAGVTHPVLAAAAGRVAFVGHGRYNGNYLILMHDFDGDGDFRDDGLRSLYLHFSPGGIVVTPGQIVAAGELLGTGGMTGLAWTPHLHFEVQRFIDGAWRSVDPFGWQGPGEDPWPYESQPLWAEAMPGS
jgi:hypothetical protein